MKTNYLFKTALLLLVAMVAGVSTAWADNNPITIPSESLTSYITIGNNGTAASGITLLGNCKVDGSSGTSYTIGSTKKDGTATFALYNATSQNYYFSFFSGSQNVATKVKFVLSDGGSYSVEKTFDVAKTGAWTLVEHHIGLFESVPTGNLALTMSFVSESTDYMGNYGYFCFTSDASLWPTLPLKVNEGEQTYVTTTATTGKTTYYGTITGGTEVSSVKDGGTAQYVLNNATAGRYLMHMGVKYYGAGTMTVTITDCATGTVEVNQVFDVPGKSNLADYEFPFFADITAGVKIVKLVFNGTGNGSGFILNYGNIYFESCNVATRYAALPLKGTNVIDFSQSYAWFQGCKAETGNVLGSIRNGYYTDGYYFYNANEEAYYDFCYNVSSYYNGGTIKLTVTDVASHIVEVNAEESSSITATGEGKFKITNALTPGLKRVRLEFVNTSVGESDYLFNLNNVSFYKRSLNEAYDYTPVEASGVDVVLTRSITAGNWSTICLPFAMTADQITEAFGSDTKVAALTSATADALTFSTVTAMEANKPYAIKVANDFSSATINGVTIVEGTPTQTVVNWQFKGTYSEVSGLASGNYYFKNNYLRQATGSQKMKPFRGYFQYTGSAAAPSLNFIIDGETTGIDDVKRETITNSGEFYDLSGRRVAQPTKGLYIVNGKKYVVK